ncbi:MAG: proton-conducting transporter membrane subunit [Acidimicrobiales bacterium]|nr:Na+/H+ antiporter subunit D [Acidimicrobiaceae bacterium]MDP6975976.1 proton-conducting transporter membrane subunit [Acidimicrobiales bacterium]
MSTDLLGLLVAIPLATAIASVAVVRHRHRQRVLGLVSLGSMLALSLGWLLDVRDGDVLVSQMGGWPAPFGITIVFDSLSGLLLCAGLVVAIGCYVHAFSVLDPETERRYFHPLVQLLLVGVNQCFLTGDLFNLFVGFELMLMASYGLLVLGHSRRQLGQAYKYLLLNLIASTVFVVSAGLVYGMFGTLNLADLAAIVDARVVSGEGLPPGFVGVSVLLLFVFGAKGAFFPLWFWLPDTYHTCPIPVAALFSGLLTKVGVYAVARTYPLVFAAGDARDVVTPLLLMSAAATMLLGVLGAVSQDRVRRILAVHVISQVGYMVFGLSLMTTAGLAGALYYMVQHMIVKSSLFLCCGVMERHTGTDDLGRLGGLYRRDRFLGVAFFVAAMSLVGLPPLSGFFGKLILVREGWNDRWWLSLVALVTGLLTLVSMLKVWSKGFWSAPAPAGERTTDVLAVGSMRGAYTGIGLLVAAAVFVGLAAEPIYDIALQAGEQLTDPTAYIEAVNPRALFAAGGAGGGG